jgi:hypothetical protein
MSKQEQQQKINTECATEYYQCTETYITPLDSTVKVTCRCPCHEQKKGTGVKATQHHQIFLPKSKSALILDFGK